eukprot:gene7585-biopygen4565
MERMRPPVFCIIWRNVGNKKNLPPQAQARRASLRQRGAAGLAAAAGSARAAAVGAAPRRPAVARGGSAVVRRFPSPENHFPGHNTKERSNVSPFEVVGV